LSTRQENNTSFEILRDEKSVTSKKFKYRIYDIQIIFFEYVTFVCFRLK
jgi:hypothetical protein